MSSDDRVASGLHEVTRATLSDVHAPIQYDSLTFSAVHLTNLFDTYMTHKNKLLTGFMLAISLCGTAMAANTNDELVDKIDTIAVGTSPHPFSGGILIKQGTQLVYLRALSQDRGPDQISPSVNSQYIIGSISKQMTAALVLREAAAKKLDLDAPIKTYLPELTEPWADNVSSKHLLNHTSGIAALGTPLNFEPGTEFAYSNLEYVLLGKIVEHTSGVPFNQLAGEIFATCHMTHSSMPPSGTIFALQKQFSRLTSGYTEQADGSLHRENAARDALTNPSGGAISTLADLARWNGCLHGRKLVADSDYQSMITPAAIAKRPYRWGTLGYGYGVQVLDTDGLLEISHSGYVPGYISTLIYYPKQQLSVVVLENTAWLSGDADRGFWFHDRIRDVIRAYLASN